MQEEMRGWNASKILLKQNENNAFTIRLAPQRFLSECDKFLTNMFLGYVKRNQFGIRDSLFI